MNQRGLHLDELPQIERDSFLHFATIARRCGHADEWMLFRDEMASALTAAFGLNSRWVDLDDDQETARIAARRECAYALIDEAAARFDPLSQWPQFREALWNGRHSLMEPPAHR
ncbi:hypothetical protein [Nitriliruptor alkaliphilus]|uniref:hypothetical protein n=1 Tax=Nitriliruptor alkaliphilus TaxID=427918 RepID=UPI00069682C0|nr:hypothetical protein [Nitriliruptor alkaliphilus]